MKWKMKRMLSKREGGRGRERERKGERGGRVRGFDI